MLDTLRGYLNQAPVTSFIFLFGLCLAIAVMPQWLLSDIIKFGVWIALVYFYFDKLKNWRQTFDKIRRTAKNWASRFSGEANEPKQPELSAVPKPAESAARTGESEG